MKYRFKYLLPLLLCALSGSALAQSTTELGNNATLDDLIDYALRNKIELKQAQLAKEIGEKEISYALSIHVPTVKIGGNDAQVGPANASALTLPAELSISSTPRSRASGASTCVRQRNELNAEGTRVAAVVDGSKAGCHSWRSEEH